MSSCWRKVRGIKAGAFFIRQLLVLGVKARKKAVRYDFLAYRVGTVIFRLARLWSA
ncbi:hypothetical protein ID855_20775 [Xenorhabdus sp. ZM]|nr:hypothetical protein [Xenorhabdus sp. ZM]